MIPYFKENLLNAEVPLAKKNLVGGSLKASLRECMISSIDSSLNTKMDMRILKNIDCGTDHVH